MKIKTILFLLLFINSNFSIIRAQEFNTYKNSFIESSRKYKNGNKYQKDFMLFIDMLNNTHPTFADQSNPPFSIKSITRKGYRWAESCNSSSELMGYMQKITSKLHDGHTSVINNSENYYFPFVVYFDDNEVFLRGISKEYESFLNNKIIKINNMPIMEVVDSFKEHINSENNNYFLSKVGGYMQYRSSWDINSKPIDSLVLSFSDNREITIPAVDKSQINMAYSSISNIYKGVRENTKQPFTYKIIEGICYLQFNACFDKNTLRAQYSGNSNISKEKLEMVLSQYSTFDDFLDGMFNDIYSNGIKTLVVDLRNNGGGNSILCDILLSHLKPLDSIKTMTSQIRFSTLWEQQYPKLAESIKKSLGESNKEYKLGDLISSDQLPRSSDYSETNSNESFVMNKGKVFDGETIFIQNQRTYSSAAMLVTNARDNGVGIVIGSKSIYSPCHYGDLLYWNLPNTNIKGIVSHKKFNRPDSKKYNERELIPDVVINNKFEDLINGRDKCWEWILTNKTK